MNQGFTIVGGLLFLLIRSFVPFGDAVLISLLAVSAMLIAGKLLGWLPAPTDQGDASPAVPPEPGLVERVRFNTGGLYFAGIRHGRWHWRDAGNLVLSLGSCPGRLGPMESDSDIVAYCRNLIEFRSSLVDARPLDSPTVRGLVCIFKLEEQPGYAYAGRLHILLRDQSIVFFLVARDHGVTGRREAIVTTEALRAGVIEIDAAAGKVKHWFKDGYDSNHDARTIRSIADDEMHDERFPDHPLSRIRRFLRQIEASFTMLPTGAPATSPWPPLDMPGDDVASPTIH